MHGVELGIVGDDCLRAGQIGLQQGGGSLTHGHLDQNSHVLQAVEQAVEFFVIAGAHFVSALRDDNCRNGSVVAVAYR